MKNIFMVTGLVVTIAALAVGCGEAVEPSTESSTVLEEMADTETSIERHLMRKY